MVDLEALAGLAERTAERSRVRMACRVGVPIAMLAGSTIAAGASITACACIAVALFVLAATLRWRDRIGVECVTAGLALGAVPAIAALLLRGCGIECRGLAALASGDVLCLLAGALTGLGVTWQASCATNMRGRRWITMMLIASMTATLGCVGVGVAALESTLLAVFATASLAVIPTAVRTT